MAVELSPLGEIKVEDGSLESSLRYDLKADADFPIFIPATTIKKGHRTSTVYLLEGYAFVASGLTPETKYFRLENKPYVEQVISTQSGPYQIRTLNVIPDIQIRDLRRQLQDIIGAEVSLGDKIQVVEGTYRGLEGVVEGKGEDLAYIHFSLRSMSVITGIPLAFLEIIKEDHIFLKIPVTPWGKKAGYLMWNAQFDRAIERFIPETTADVWLGDEHIGLKTIDRKRRRMYVSQEKVITFVGDKEFFIVKKNPRGEIVITCK